jgi:uncharacterized protein YndB with AHSA1/START domain
VVDVLVERDIPRSPASVSAVAGNPSRAPDWYVNIKSVEWRSEPEVRVGAQIAFVAHFLGRRIAYVYEIRELVPGERLVMSTADGPFPMETTYTWEASPPGTRMTLRNRGEPTGFFGVLAPLMAMAMRRAMTADLAKLSALVEAENPLG